MVYAYTGVVITMLFWGSAFNAMSYVIQYMPPLSAAAERFTIASLGLFILFAAIGKLRWAALRQNLAIYLIIGIIGMIYAELSGDFPLGDSRQPIYKSLRPFDLVS